MYGQPGPSVNGTAFPNHPYAHQQFGPARGRGNNYATNGFQRGQRQPNNYYANRNPPLHPGYSSPGVNGRDRLATNDLSRYAHVPNGQAVSPLQRGRPNFPPPITSPPIPSPVQMYGVHNPPLHPYFSPGPPSTSPPAMYHYPHHPQSQMQPFLPPPFIPAQPQPTFSYGQHPALRPPEDQIPDQILRSPESRRRSSPHPQPQSFPPTSINATSPKILTPVLAAEPEPVASEPATRTPSPPQHSQSIDEPFIPLHIQKQDLSFGSSSSLDRPIQILHYTGEDHGPIPDQEWVISALRPDNPSDAFGIMISPKAKPPPRVVEAALEYASPVRSSVYLPKLPEEHIKASPNVSEVSDGEPLKASETVVDDHVPSPRRSDPISSSATETESAASTAPDAFVPGSPVSTNTSISLAVPKANAETREEIAEMPPSTTSPVVTAEIPLPSEVQPLSAVSQPTAPPAVKKSWASLLRSEGSSKSSLPTSNVIGFSIPAEERKTSSGSSLPASLLGKRNELLQLLTNGANSVGVPNIRPRGLINTGNMCFANAVLQTLVYCPPFYRFFTELGKYIPGPKAESSKWNGKTTPLVEATVDFLKEFSPKSRNEEVDEDDYDGIDSFLPSNIYEAMKDKSRLDGMRVSSSSTSIVYDLLNTRQGAQQEDAEEFFGFFLDTLEEELLSISNTLKPSAAPAPLSEPASNSEEGWLEVGKKNRAVITRSVS